MATRDTWFIKQTSHLCAVINNNNNKKTNNNKHNNSNKPVRDIFSLFIHWLFCVFTHTFICDCRQSALQPATHKIGRCSSSALPRCAWCGMTPCSTGCQPASYLKALISSLSLETARSVVNLPFQLSLNQHMSAGSNSWYCQLVQSLSHDLSILK